MRESLKKYKNQRLQFTAMVGRMGKKNGWKGKVDITLLLLDMKLSDGESVTNHIWVNWTKTLQDSGVKEGDIINFKGTVEAYQKGYFGRRDDVYSPVEWDYKVSRLSNVSIETYQLK